MINANIPLLGQSPDMIEAVNNGFADGGNFAKLLIGSQANRMRDLDGYEKQKAFADNNFFGRQLRGQLKQDQATALQTQIAQEKAFAEIGKTQSEAFKNNQTGQGDKLKNAQSLLTSANQALYAASQTGDANAVKLALNNGKTAGVLDDATYDQYYKTAETLASNPQGLKEFALSIQQAYSQNPEKINFTTADNALDNQTSIANNQLTNQTSRQNNQENNQTTLSVNESKLGQDQAQFNVTTDIARQKAYFEQNKPQSYQQGADGSMYAIYPQGAVKVLDTATGAPIQVKSKNSETPIQKMERKEKTVDFSIAAQGAAEGSKLAAALANDLNGINSAGGTSIYNLAARKIPGTDAYNYTQKLETLKANVFLSQVSKMKGMGALTEAEGARLEKAIASLDVGQDPTQLQKNLTEIAKQLSLIAKTNSNKTKIYAGVPTQPASTQASLESGFDVKSFFNE